MKTKRNLSGIWFFRKNSLEELPERICFEDMEFNEQIKTIQNMEREKLISLSIQLADTLNNIDEQFDIIKK